MRDGGVPLVGHRRLVFSLRCDTLLLLVDFAPEVIIDENVGKRLAVQER